MPDVEDAVVITESAAIEPPKKASPVARAKWLEPDARVVAADAAKAIEGLERRKRAKAKSGKDIGGQFADEGKPKRPPQENRSGGRQGRPPGSTTRFSVATRAAAMATGLLPHEILLEMARGQPMKMPIVNRETGRITGYYYIAPDLDMRKEAAVAAAPYYAPRLAQIEFGAALTAEELDANIALLAAEAGVDVAFAGASETS